MKVLWGIGAGFVGITASLELNQNFDGRISGSKMNQRHLEGERRGLCQVGLEKRKDLRETRSSCGLYALYLRAPSKTLSASHVILRSFQLHQGP